MTSQARPTPMTAPREVVVFASQAAWSVAIACTAPVPLRPAQIRSSTGATTLDVQSTAADCGRSEGGPRTKMNEQPETARASSNAANFMRLFHQVARDSANRRLRTAHDDR